MKIKELTLYTPRLTSQLRFYTEVLGFQLIHESDQSFSVKIGASVLTWIYREQCTPYHFAFNIPSNQKKEALQWLKSRVDILKDGQEEIQYFDFWDAYAIYFYDEDNNIVEFIARSKRGKLSNTPFAQSSLLEISEIGIPTDSIRYVYEQLNRTIGLEIHSGSLDRFCAIGEETGLLICIDKNKKKEWFPTNDATYVSDFNAVIGYNAKRYKVTYQEGELTIDNKH